TRCYRDWSSDVCSSDLLLGFAIRLGRGWGRLPSGFAPPLGGSLLSRLGLCLELGLGSRFRLCFQFRLGLADSLGAQLLVRDPISSEDRRVGQECSVWLG